MSARRWLYLLHRWAGIALCLVMALWFVSGLVMLYVGYPKLTPAEQLRGLAPLPTQGCCVPLKQALQASGLHEPRQWRLASVAGQPRYFFGDGRKTLVAVDALTGQRISSVSEDEAVAAARHFAAGVDGQSLGPVQEDAWTHSRALDAYRPLHRVAVADAAHNWLYVSAVSGEVVRDASITERTWGWLGAWLHWLYIFRGGALGAWWTDIVIALSLAGCVLGLSGLTVGIWRWRFKGRYKSGSRSPYRAPLARWHHVLGLVGGLLALTWVLSGLLSLNPWRVFEAGGPKLDSRAYAGGLLQAQAGPSAEAVLATLAERGFAARTLEWRRVGGRQYVWAQSPAGGMLLDAQARPLQALDEAALVAAAAPMLPQARIQGREWLRSYDAYYYAREPHTMTGQRERPLPALRLVFDDAQAHWVVLDPASGALLQTSNSRQRLERWLFAFLHSFDLPQLLALRPLWDGWMLGFGLAGLALCLSGVWLGWRRLRMRHG
ncbi:putative iron-regulated membrane protein [Paucibacter oligotrophus]|uniref:Putative iron-regulated membrane protein n=1 Tax=Roseateles oligotrophus TaxID=1769250 RepID=A0A840L3D8_9BURK|nr:PepSY domain-containing protein [Roseateles oligotrophus]MBB4843014.1 putative iron-regulated membrane protein [Roseateles oligotrophus]